MANSLAYWEKRQAQEVYEELRKAEDTAEELRRAYLIAARSIEQEAAKIAKRFQMQNHLSQAAAYRLLEQVKSPEDIKKLIAELKKDPRNAGLVAELEAQAYATRIRDLASLMASIDLTCSALFKLAEPKTRKVLEDIGRSMYYRQIFAMQQRSGYGFNFRTLSPRRIENILNRNWAGGGNFSARLWGNTDRLAKQVKEELIVNLLTGRPPQKMVEAIDARFSAGATAARRLVRTESTYVANQLQMEAYEECDVEKYIYVAVLDLRTSEICKGLDKKRFLLSSAQVGKNYPPMHPWCRSTTIAWMPDELLRTLKQKAYDPETGRNKTVSGDMTYEQWYRENVERRDTPYASDVAQTNNEDVQQSGNDDGTAEQRATATQKAAPLQDITDEWIAETPWDKPDVVDADEIIAENGKTYSLSAGTADNGQHEPYEQTAAEIVSMAKAEQVKMLPRVKENDIHSPDCSIGGVMYEMKRVTGSNAGTIKKRVKRAREQSPRVILYLDDTPMTDEEIDNALKRMKNSPDIDFLKELVVIRHGAIKEVWGRQ